MPKIAKVWMDNIRYGWLFDIETIDGMYDYLDAVIAPRARGEFAEALKYARGQAHANMVATIAEMRGITLIDASLKLNTDRARGMERVLSETGRIFVNGNGGYFGMRRGIIATDSRVIDVWALPDEGPRFIQWEGGIHWYAKIGDEDIIVDGKQKWDTKREAEIAAKKFLEGKSR